MTYKSKDADRLNDQNEKFRSERERQLKKEIELATREPAASPSPDSKTKSSRKSTSGGLEEGAATPSICPSTPLEAKVRGHIMVCLPISLLSCSGCS